MSFLDFLREFPFVDDIIDTIEAVEVCLDGFCPEGIASDVVASESDNIANEVSSVIPFDYGAFRDQMYWTEVDDTGQSTREWLLEKSSLVPVEKDSSGQILSGQWCDPHTGFISSDPEDFDIDHRMPFSKIMESYPEIYELPRDEQLAIYNDPDNLQILHDDHNMEKGAQSGEAHAMEITDEEFRERFLADYLSYKEVLRKRFSH